MPLRLTIGPCQGNSRLPAGGLALAKTLTLWFFTLASARLFSLSLMQDRKKNRPDSHAKTDSHKNSR